jgi:hypothetical protein
MSDDNGSSSGGGNSSVFWETRGSRVKPERPTLANPISWAAAAAGAVTKAIDGAVDIADMDDYPGPGQVKIGRCGGGEGSVQGHDTTDFAKIGAPEHPGKFRVSLRFRREDLENPKLISPEYRRWIEKNASMLRKLTGQPADTSNWKDGDVYLVIDVPAILRKPLPPRGGPWPDMPWEIHWEW